MNDQLTAEQVEAIWDNAKVGDPRPPRYPQDSGYCPGADDGYLCLRLDEHRGQHVATVPGMVVHVWPNEVTR
jgi:hypothetical protein